MDITSAEFIKGIRGTDAITKEPKPQIAFIGRSNVGKSSLINSLTKRKGLVRSSSTPGKTTEINYFLINNSHYFVDLPGYGYAKRPEKNADQIRKMILWFLFDEEFTDLKVVLIIDAEVGVTKFDNEMLEYLLKYKIPCIIVANKIDKIKNAQMYRKMKELQTQVGEMKVIPYSAKTDTGRLELLNTIMQS
jgi:GTP-binding protein